MDDTIFALSSGPPPAAIAIVRISGVQAGAALSALCGRLPKSRRATLVTLRDPGDGDVLDNAVVLWLPGPTTATGEDGAELHLHGGRAVVAAVERALETLPGLRRAEAGEFTRRAFANGRIDLAQAEGLADLLSAETELQRRSAQALAAGALSQRADRWRTQVLELGARVEAALDFSDEDDVPPLDDRGRKQAEALVAELTEWLERPRAEPLQEGFKVVLGGPPNVGKSTLFNALVDDAAAIISDVPGTTRDVLTKTVAIAGVPLQFIDTAGLRDASEDPIERIGIGRAREAADAADLVLWLGASGEGPSGVTLWEIDPQSDRVDRPPKLHARHRVSALNGEGLDALRSAIVSAARSALPQPGAVALGQRQHRLLEECRDAVGAAVAQPDPLLTAESLRVARSALDRMLGRSGTEDMLDALFGRFCIGK